MLVESERFGVNAAIANRTLLSVAQLQTPRHEFALPGWAATQPCKRSKDSTIGRNFATKAARISAVKPEFRLRTRQKAHKPVDIPQACLRITTVGAQEGVDILPLCSRGIIVKVFANVFFKIGKPQRDMLAAARASPAFQRYVSQRK